MMLAERATPKINLTLRVLGRRPDGYHELESLVAFAVDAADVVTFWPGAERGVSVTGPFAGSIAGENLIAVTLDHVARAAPQLRLGAVELEKNLPIAAGIGGGSADAAAVLRAIRRANLKMADGVDWIALAAHIGADVPVCMASTAQRMTGLGEKLVPVAGLPGLTAVLVNPMVAVPADKTAQVFRALRAKPLAGPSEPSNVMLLDRAALFAHMADVGNDLTAAARAVVPAIDAVLAALRAARGCELAQLSGGGPTCFGMFPDMAHAHDAAARITATHPAWWVVASRLV